MKPFPFLLAAVPAGSSERAALEAAILSGEEMSPAESPPTSPGAWTVLVVDDDADTRHYVGHCLESAKLSRPIYVVDAPEGAAALRCLRSRPADLVVADVHMPGLDGAGLAAALAADAALAHLPILFVSGDAEAARVLARGPHHFLQKPFNRQRLVEAVRALLDDTLPV